MKLVLIGGGNTVRDDLEKPYNLDEIDNQIVKLANKKYPRFLYLGFNIRADYYFSHLKKTFMEKGCQCEYLRFSEFDNAKTVENKFKRADIIFLPGGNTLEYMKKIRKYNIGDYIKSSAERGVVIAGISAGAIMCCEYGCSDSIKSDAVPRRYMKVMGLGLVNGLVAPHFSNSDRIYDLPRMLKRCNRTMAFGIDECASLIVVGDEYSVVKSSDNAKVFKCYYKNNDYISQEIKESGKLFNLYQR